MIPNAHDPSTLIMDPTYLVERTERALIIQVTLNAGRTVELKKKFYRAIADGLHEAIGIRTEDVFINLVEVPKENWSFGCRRSPVRQLIAVSVPQKLQEKPNEQVPNRPNSPRDHRCD